MTTAEITNAAITAKNAIDGYKTNKTIMDFVTTEAREKVATEIRKELGGSTTAKAVALLEIRYPNIKTRVQEYIDLGLIGCFFASLEAAA
jgi:hypothetical protein